MSSIRIIKGISSAFEKKDSILEDYNKCIKESNGRNACIASIGAGLIAKSVQNTVSAYAITGGISISAVNPAIGVASISAGIHGLTTSHKTYKTVYEKTLSLFNGGIMKEYNEWKSYNADLQRAIKRDHLTSFASYRGVALDKMKFNENLNFRNIDENIENVFNAEIIERNCLDYDDGIIFRGIKYNIDIPKEDLAAILFLIVIEGCEHFGVSINPEDGKMEFSDTSIRSKKVFNPPMLAQFQLGRDLIEADILLKKRMYKTEESPGTKIVKFYLENPTINNAYITYRFQPRKAIFNVDKENGNVSCESMNMSIFTESPLYEDHPFLSDYVKDYSKFVGEWEQEYPCIKKAHSAMKAVFLVRLLNIVCLSITERLYNFINDNLKVLPMEGYDMIIMNEDIFVGGKITGKGGVSMIGVEYGIDSPWRIGDSAIDKICHECKWALDPQMDQFELYGNLICKKCLENLKTINKFRVLKWVDFTGDEQEELIIEGMLQSFIYDYKDFRYSDKFREGLVRVLNDDFAKFKNKFFANAIDNEYITMLRTVVNSVKFK